MIQKSKIPWIKKYEPLSSKDIFGQDVHVSKIEKFIKFYSTSKKKALLLHGSTGIGKTSTIHAISRELDLEIIEINASDFRNKDQINSVIGNAMGQMSLFMKEKLILIDEVDGISGTKDRGGIQEITKLISNSNYPVILTANDVWDKKFNSLRKICDMIEFNELSYKEIFLVLKKVCDSEKINYEEEILKSFARRVGVDVRAAINDLQSATMNGKLDKESLETLSQRNKKEEMSNALLKIFKTTNAKVALNAFDSVNEDMDKCMLWIDENLSREYKRPEDLARAYDKLSRAEIFMSRIKRRQHWRFLVYVNALLTAGIATAKDEKYREFIKYQPTQRILKLWQANMKYMKRKAIAAKVGNETHTSSKYAITDTLPYLSIILSKDKEMGGLIADELDLGSDEVTWLKSQVNV